MFFFADFLEVDAFLGVSGSLRFKKVKSIQNSPPHRKHTEKVPQNFAFFWQSPSPFFFLQSRNKLPNIFNIYY
jgi:hypothetical protein